MPLPSGLPWAFSALTDFSLAFTNRRQKPCITIDAATQQVVAQLQLISIAYKRTSKKIDAQMADTVALLESSRLLAPRSPHCQFFLTLCLTEIWVPLPLLDSAWYSWCPISSRRDTDTMQKERQPTFLCLRFIG